MIEMVAALALLRARAALAAHEPERARSAVRDGYRALERVRRETSAPLPPELEPLAAGPAATALELSGLGLRAARAAGHPEPTAAAAFLRDLERGVRVWTLAPSSWPADAQEAARAAPDDACLVFAAAGEPGPALVLDARGPIDIVTVAEAVDAPAGFQVKPKFL